MSLEGKENQTTVRTEILAGITTFLTMAYIIFVQPAVLSGRLLGLLAEWLLAVALVAYFVCVRSRMAG